jgi:hypothetical protein
MKCSLRHDCSFSSSVFATNAHSERFHLLWYCAVYFVMNQRFGGAYHLHLQCQKSADQETNLQQVPGAVNHYIPEVGSFHIYRCEYLRSCVVLILLRTCNHFLSFKKKKRWNDPDKATTLSHSYRRIDINECSERSVLNILCKAGSNPNYVTFA